MECPKCKGEMELGIYQTEELDYDRVVSCTNKQCDFEYSITEFFDIYTDLAEINEGLKAENLELSKVGSGLQDECLRLETKVNELEVENENIKYWKNQILQRNAEILEEKEVAEKKVIELENIMTDVKRELQDILENKGSE